MVKLKHRIIRLIEQPSTILELINGVKPRHSKYMIMAKTLLKENPKTFIDVGASDGEIIKAFKFNFRERERTQSMLLNQ